VADTRGKGRICLFLKGVSEMANRKRYDKEFRLEAAGYTTVIANP
jgi:hypothetical protein